jgi:hypothetical protein
MYTNTEDSNGIDQSLNVLAGLKSGELRPVALDRLVKDPDNPGWNAKKSLRKAIQAEKIGEAYEMFNNNVIVPIVVCKHETKQGYFRLIDGHGRVSEAEDRGFDEVDARVLEPLNNLQRIVLRESLNNGQTSFDPTVQLADVFLAAKQMNKDVRESEDVEEILAVFPPTLRRSARKKLKLLRDWPASIVKQLSADAVKVGGIAYNKIEELTPLANLLKKKHAYGEEVYASLVDLYKSKAFSGGRSQETIRDAKRIIGQLPPQHTLVKQFLGGALDLPELEEKAKSVIEELENEDEKLDHAAVFHMVMQGLDTIEFDQLDQKQKKGLIRKLQSRLTDWKD